MRYVIACACGQQIEVTSVMAGSEMRCRTCRQFVEVPSLTQLRELPPEDVDAPQRPPTRRGLKLGLLTLLTLLFVGFTAAGYAPWVGLCGYVVSFVGYFWLLFQMRGHVSGGAALIAFFVPPVLFFYAIYHWNVAYAPTLFTLIGMFAVWFTLFAR